MKQRAVTTLSLNAFCNRSCLIQSYINLVQTSGIKTAVSNITYLYFETFTSFVFSGA